jgi:hypothetical protein
MSFEQQLTQAFATLSERLRGEIDEEVQRRTADAIAALPPPPPPEVHEPPAPAQPTADLDAAPPLAAAFEAIDRARTLTEVLDTLLSAAREHVPHADVWLMRGGRLHRWHSARADGSSDEVAPRLEDGVPLTVGGTIVGVLSVGEAGETIEPGTQNSGRNTGNVELLARFASRCLESLTAFTTARALTEHARAPQAASSTTPAGEGAEEDVAARRYARLLVSEIKLYHEPAVVEGRRDRDLATWLGGEIARARAMYEQRVPPHVRDRADHFHDELVKTLANGDATLLEVRS